MKMRNSFLLFLSLAFLFAACDNKTTGFKKLDSGLEYSIITDAGKPKAQKGQIVEINLTYGIDDSMFFSTKQMNQTIAIEVMDPPFKGSFEEGFSLLGVGDSAVFHVNVDSVYEKIFRMPKPKEFSKDQKFHFNVGVVRIRDEKKELADYMKKNNLQGTPTESGLIYIRTQEGSGPQAQKGQKVQVLYTGMLLDGKKFDSSYDRVDSLTKKPTPFEFTLGMGQVIPGWDEGISLMKVGEKGILLIPSKLAYGIRGAGEGIIPGYATLRFEVELLGISK